MLSISDFSDQIVDDEKQKKLFELNPNRKEYTEVISKDFPDYKYLFIENMYQNPYDIRDYLMRSSYICSTNILSKEKTGAPGMQQPVANDWVKHFLIYCTELLRKHQITKKDILWQNFQCYCNVFWTKMQSMNSNFRPHVDPGDLAFNYFLSDDLGPEAGTAMYSIKVMGEEYMDVRHMQKAVTGRRDEDRFMMELTNAMSSGRSGSGESVTYRTFEGDQWFTKKGVVPYGFNCLSAYRGSVYHSANYDVGKYPEDHCRYSLVAMLAMTMPGVGSSFQS